MSTPASGKRERHRPDGRPRHAQPTTRLRVRRPRPAPPCTGPSVVVRGSGWFAVERAPRVPRGRGARVGHCRDRLPPPRRSAGGQAHGSAQERRQRSRPGTGCRVHRARRACASCKGEDAAGGRHKSSILSDALEAVLGAVYLDGGVDAAKALIARLFSGRLETAAGQLDRLDHKTVLQELTARLYDKAPVYLLTETGPDHSKTFTATVMVDGVALGVGEGRSKKLAEQHAASEAFDALSTAT